MNGSSDVNKSARLCGVSLHAATFMKLFKFRRDRVRPRIEVPAVRFAVRCKKKSTVKQSGFPIGWVMTPTRPVWVSARLMNCLFR